MKSKPFGVLFGLLALVAILGVAPAFGETAEVDIAAGAGSSASAACVTTNNCFTPNPLTVAPGTEVEWKNTDTLSHTVTSGKVTDDNAGSMFDSGLVKKGQDFKFTFPTAGTYDYFCTVHPWMVGQVIVGGAAASGTTPATPAPAGNATVPEFGPVASIVLAIAVLSMVVFAAKTRVIPKL
jgi:plastocyanin